MWFLLLWSNYLFEYFLVYIDVILVYSYNYNYFIYFSFFNIKPQELRKIHILLFFVSHDEIWL